MKSQVCMCNVLHLVVVMLGVVYLQALMCTCRECVIQRVCLCFLLPGTPANRTGGHHILHGVAREVARRE